MAPRDKNTGVNDKELIQDVSTDEDEDPPGDADRRAYKVTAGEDLRKLEELGNSGLQAEYQCSRCRACRLCKDAGQTEKTTLRQDAEEDLIKQSVTLNYGKKEILATLPIRGREEDFLISNRSTAKCILDQQ